MSSCIRVCTFHTKIHVRLPKQLWPEGSDPVGAHTLCGRVVVPLSGTLFVTRATGEISPLCERDGSNSINFCNWRFISR